MQPITRYILFALVLLGLATAQLATPDQTQPQALEPNSTDTRQLSDGIYTTNVSVEEGLYHNYIVLPQPDGIPTQLPTQYPAGAYSAQLVSKGGFLEVLQLEPVQ